MKGWMWLAALALGSATLPFVMDRGALFLASEVLVLLALAQAWNLAAGYGGLLSLGHHGFIGLGGYALFVVTRDLPVHPYLAVPAAGVIVAALACALAPLLFRLRSVYFAVGMWVVAEILRILIMRWDFTGAASGLPLAAARSLDRAWMGASAYWLSLGCAVLATAACLHLAHSLFGLRLRALRDDEIGARSLGVAPNRVLLAIFVLSAGLTGMAGAAQFLSVLFITPAAGFDITWTVNIVFVTIIGGIGRLAGPFYGTALFFALRELLGLSAGWSSIALGVAAVVVMLFFPGGLATLADRLSRFLFPKRTAL